MGLPSETARETKSDMVAAHQARVARIAVGASAARNQGGTGVVEAARRHFAALDLGAFSAAEPEIYRLRLDEATDHLQRALPGPASSWGLARKLLNIFIRDASYHVVLNAEYELGRARAHMELPLDSLTAAALKKELPPRTLPLWPGVKNLERTLSDRFQQEALEVAQTKRLFRVDLDVLWWGVRG